MAKDLPYFKFIVSEWNDGDITLCSMEAQGLFINVCSLYWSSEGNLSYTKTKRRYTTCIQTVWDELLNEGILKLDGDQIKINFLDEQLRLREVQSKTNTENVKRRWEKENNTIRIRSYNGRKDVEYNIEKRREEKRREDIEHYYTDSKTAFEDISNNFNETEPQKSILANKGWKSVTKEDVDKLLYHFLASQVRFDHQDRKDVASHFRRWLNKIPLPELRELTQKIHERFQG